MNTIKNRNKGGRPKKGIAVKKKYKVTIKMDTSDYYMLKAKAKISGRNTSEYLRSLIGSSSVVERLSTEHTEYIRQLCGMANNLNQIAKKVNTLGYKPVHSEYFVLAEKIHSIINDMFR